MAIKKFYADFTAYLFEGWPAPDVKKRDLQSLNPAGESAPVFDPFSYFSESKPVPPPPASEQK